mmetsp:Transcript_18341/g.33239  ORF Transcript_18341/g.33239 Transcript_18341/m.33239 type:complete len:225 (+) Transcript_18341:43-717(+)
MPTIGDVCGFLGFGTQFFTSYFLQYPPGPLAWTSSPTRPALTKYTGKLILLTMQTNLFGALYYSLRVAASLDMLKSWQPTLALLFPSIFGLGAFLTSGYYGLDHFNAEGAKIRKRIEERGYPAVHYLCHLDHCLSLPVVLVDALSGSVPAYDETALVGGVTCLAIYMVLYVACAQANWKATGEWPYAIVDDVQANGGTVGRYIFFGVIIGIVVSLGALGKALVR